MSLFAEVAGEGPDLVLLHGWSMNSAIWKTFKAHLGPGLRLTCIDLPGHGLSPFAPARRTLNAWAEACLQAAPPGAVWVGWSLGAMLSLAAAGRAPASVSGVVCLAGTPRFVQTDDWPHAVAVGTLGQFSTSLREDYRTTMMRFLALQVQGGADARATLRQLREGLADRPEPDPEALEVGLGLLRRSDLRRELQAIRCPCLWLLGERDTLVPAAVAEDLRVLHPAGRVRVIKRAAHAPFLSRAAATAAAIREFLADSLPGQPPCLASRSSGPGKNDN